MKKKYRIRKYIGYDFECDTIVNLYYIEQKIFGLFWNRIENFKPITSQYRFLSIEKAEDVLRRYNEYLKHKHENGKVVKLFEF